MYILPIATLAVLIYSIFKTVKFVDSMREENFKLKISKAGGIKDIISVNFQNKASLQMFLLSIVSLFIVIYSVIELLGSNPNLEKNKGQFILMALFMLCLSLITILSVVRHTYKGLVAFGIKQDEIMLHGDTYKLEHFKSYNWNREKLFVELERNYKNLKGANSDGNILYEVYVPRSKRARTEEVLEKMTSSSTIY